MEEVEEEEVVDKGYMEEVEEEEVVDKGVWRRLKTKK